MKMLLRINEFLNAGEKDRSGIFFGLNPSSSNESIIESVYGLNQALVDGDAEPDRWILSRSTGKVITHTHPVREKYAAHAKNGIAFHNLQYAEAKTPPLTQDEIYQIWKCGNQLEDFLINPRILNGQSPTAI